MSNTPEIVDRKLVMLDVRPEHFAGRTDARDLSGLSDVFHPQARYTHIFLFNNDYHDEVNPYEEEHDLILNVDGSRPRALGMGVKRFSVMIFPNTVEGLDNSHSGKRERLVRLALYLTK